MPKQYYSLSNVSHIVCQMCLYEGFLTEAKYIQNLQFGQYVVTMLAFTVPFIKLIYMQFTRS